MNHNTRFMRLLSALLALVLVIGCLPVSGVRAAEKEEFLRVFHLDAGRKFFTVDQVEEIIDTLSANGYTHLELAVGNDALRFLLDDMSVTANGTTYSHDTVANAIHSGNVSYYNAGSQNEWSESEMDAIIAYAAEKHIEIIPLINNPGHMDAIIDAMSAAGISGAYNNSARTVDVTNTTAVAFTQALVEKYVAYFAEKGCEYFNMGADEYANDRYTSGSMGFGHLISSGKYSYFVSYVNQVAAIIKDYGMKPIAFNDGIYFNQTTSGGAFDTDIIIAYWSSGWTNYNVASASFLANKGHAILNTNDGWYYVLGRNSGNTYSLTTANSNTKNTPVTDVPGSSDPAPMGAMICLWCDTPSASYSSNKSNVLKLIRQLADNNPDYFVVYTEPEHVYETVTVEATCTQGGSVTTTCTICGESTVEIIPATGHDYHSVTTGATCTEGGFTVNTCALCGDSYVSDETAALGHAYKAVVTAPDCTEGGFTTYTCANCGDSYVSDETAALGHDYTSVVTEPTCTEDGFTTHTCLSCGDSYISDEVPALIHDRVSVVTEPTCTEVGYTTHTCTVCGAVTVDSHTAALGHDYETITVEATCTRDGSVERTCLVCGEASTEILPAAGHANETVTAEATCIQDGSVTTTCLSCGETSMAVLPALGHDYESVVTAVTCTADGFTTHTCLNCGDSYTSDVIAAPGHAYDSVITAPTCIEGGFTVTTCLSCGDSYVSDETAALGHDYASVVTAPTCTEDGFTVNTCENCGDSYVSDEIAATGHSYTSAEEDGYLIHNCENCGDSYAESVGWIAVTGKYVLDTDGADIGAGHKYLVVGSNSNYALTLSGSTIGAAAVSVVNNTITLADASSYEFWFVGNSAESGSYLLTQDGSKGVYHMGGNLYYGSDNKGYWHFGSASNGAYQLWDYDNQTWYLNYGYVWGSQSVSRFAVSSTARTVRLFKATDSFLRLTGEVKQTYAHGADATVEAILAKLAVQTSEDGSSVASTAAVTADMLSWDVPFDGYTAGTYTAAVTYNGTELGTVTVAVTGEHAWQTAVTEPTCTEGGCTTNTCLVCGLTETGSHTDALGHSYESTEDGEQITYTCTVCGDSYTESLVSYTQVSSIANGNAYVITVYSGGKYYALSHAGNSLSTVTVSVSNGEITSEVTGDLLWDLSGGKLCYTSGSTTRYLYASGSGWGGWWGNWWGGSATLSLSTSNSSSVSLSNNRLKIGSYYLRYSGGSIGVNSSAGTAYLFVEN